MRLLPSLLGLLGLFAPAYAMVYNLSAPSTVPNGGNLTATLYTADYIQNWVDFGVRPFPTAASQCSMTKLVCSQLRPILFHRAWR
jgi:hypothetical protein